MRSFSCFKPRDPFRNWSKELDKRVAIWARNFDSSFKLLLLGPAGAGKTTIMKQMKIIHFEGFSLEERQQKAKEIRANLLESVRELTACITASGHQIDWHDQENQTRLDFINGLNLDDQTYDIYAAKIYDYSKRILTDKGVEDLFAKLNQLSITHRSQYLLNRVDEIRNANYIPNNDDILQSRRKTSDIQKLEFQVKLPVKSGPSIQQTFCMFDVGGQRGERRKWIQVFDGVSAVMFLIDSSSFDAIDDENGRNKLKETINLFYEVWTTRFLLNSNFVLLFNKQDILREKIERGHKIEDHFPEYKLYKFQPTERHLSQDSRSSEKLNLFRTSSSRSTRSTASSGRPSNPLSASLTNPMDLSVGSQLATNLSGPDDDGAANWPLSKSKRDNTNQRADASSTTKRKSASLYLFKTSSSSSSSKQNKSARSPSIVDRTAPTPTPTTTPAQSKPITTNLDNLTSGSGADGRQRQIDRETANHLAYIKARSFIRDKFIQITRQVDQPLVDQRKFSSPNLPVYNTKVAGSGSGAGTTQSTRVDRPKRNVCYHYTTATDTENIRDLFENLQKMVLKSTMKDLVQ